MHSVTTDMMQPMMDSQPHDEMRRLCWITTFLYGAAHTAHTPRWRGSAIMRRWHSAWMWRSTHLQMFVSSTPPSSPHTKHSGAAGSSHSTHSSAGGAGATVARVIGR